MPAYAQSPIRNTWISCLHVDKQKRFWVGTNKGLFLYDYVDGTFSPANLNGKLPKDQIMAISEDRNGNLLIGTYENGLSAYPPDK